MIFTARIYFFIQEICLSLILHLSIAINVQRNISRLF
jgi:hypothetical protein